MSDELYAPINGETAQRIWAWMRETFGYEGMTDRYLLTRAMDELNEALDALDVSEENTHAMVKEAADAMILLLGLMGKYTYSPETLVNQKMIVNRRRKWEYRYGKWQHQEGV